MVKSIISTIIIITLLSSCGSDIQIGGCIDPIAENYDAYADYDNGSCVYILGCTDLLADNWDPIATLETLDICQYSANLVYYLDYSASQYMLNWGISYYSLSYCWGESFPNPFALQSHSYEVLFEQGRSCKYNDTTSKD